ncbi:MAG TPA: nuclear transport factor 2 family protein [Casimicrobiaceae bacterium]|nr:nuclear transport factor 2 family protein [Casimicrobiaceae bacterium]
MLRFYASWQAGDFATMSELVSPKPYSLVIGTDPEEWWSAAEGALEIWRTQVQEMGRITVGSTALTAYCCGNVGWIADRLIITLQSGVSVTMRVTAVLVIERGHWRFVQMHCSLGQSNEQSLGMTLTTSIDEIERSVRAERPDVGQASAPDGTVTIVFSDIESSTVLLDRLGDADFLRMLSWHDDIVRNTADEHRGYVVKSQGDGFMLAFPSAAFALRASLVMRDRISAGYGGLPVRIRAGLHSGEAIRHGDDFYGRTVVIAARISALALGGEILASDLVYALARSLGTFKFGEPRSAVLKGLDGSFELHPVLH